MRNYNGKLVELPRHGKAIVVTDLHGNLEDYRRYLEIWNKCDKKRDHFVITGDFIHATGRKNDRSVEILESVKNNWEKWENFHPLLGNHEWATISTVSVYKGGMNQSHNFELLLMERFGDEWKNKLEEYQTFFKNLPVAVKTANNVFISHAGPPTNISDLDDIINITNKGYSENNKLYQLIWNREEDFSSDDLESFLKKVGCSIMIVGHTPVNGTKLIGNRQIIVSSSYSLGKKSYISLDLEKNIDDTRDILKMVKNLHTATKILKLNKK